MPLVAVVLVLVAAVIHVAWNAVVKTSGEPLRVTARAVRLGTLVYLPVLVVAWLANGRTGLSADGYLLVLLSGALEVGYWVLLAHGYRIGSLSAVYPLARGTGALLGALIGIVVLQERLALPELAGIGLLLAGTIAVASSATRRAQLLPALGTGVLIAAYSFVDRLGARSGPSWLYGYLLFVGGSVLLEPVLRWAPDRLRGRAPMPGSAEDPGWRAPLLVGVMMMTTYFLVLAALAMAPLAGVAPLRESATVLAAGWGVVVLHEREHAARRLAGAGAVAAGAVLLALGG